MGLDSFHKCSKIQTGNGPAKALLLVIAVMDGERGCFASFSTLAAMLSISKRTVINAMSALEKLELVSVTRRRGSKSVIRVDVKKLDEYLTGERCQPVKEVHQCKVNNKPEKEVHHTGEADSSLKEKKDSKEISAEKQSSPLDSEQVAVAIFSSGSDKTKDDSDIEGKSTNTRPTLAGEFDYKPWTMAQYIADRKRNGWPIVPRGSVPATTAEDLGLPAEFLAIAWYELVMHYQNRTTRYSNWLEVLETKIRSGDGLWAGPDREGDYRLTRRGEQIKALLDAKKQHERAAPLGSEPHTNQPMPSGKQDFHQSAKEARSGFSELVGSAKRNTSHV